ncbi:conserved hypothetical protein [Trichinella spiralis]|uniref:hypothetical protein n=1 Tax=Trichinella spiralis TaxID=6334 RepID=UPI0001EFDAF6|nr:conserved hypothetical protein [Trichinella spiralis]
MPPTARLNLFVIIEPDIFELVSAIAAIGKVSKRRAVREFGHILWNQSPSSIIWRNTHAGGSLSFFLLPGLPPAEPGRGPKGICRQVRRARGKAPQLAVVFASTQQQQQQQQQ